MPDENIVAELDARHADARRAFDARALAAYRALFHPDLAYRRSDGEVIGRDALMRDVGRQFANLSRISSSFARQRLTTSGSDAIETLTQTAHVEATAFGLVHRSWHLERRGDYTWTKDDGVWRILRVEVHSESLTPAGWRFGLR